MQNRVEIYTDGGSRGNPGRAGIGAVIKISGKPDKEYGEYIGIATNNQAEYRAVIFGLKKVKQLLGSKNSGNAIVEVFTDSELIARQFNREYKIKEDELKRLFVDAWNATLDFKLVDFTHVPREKNKRADKLVNVAIDAAGW